MRALVSFGAAIGILCGEDLNASSNRSFNQNNSVHDSSKINCSGPGCSSWGSPAGNGRSHFFQIEKFKLYFDAQVHEHQAEDGSYVAKGEITFSGSYHLDRLSAKPDRIYLRYMTESGQVLGSLFLPATENWEQAQPFTTPLEIGHGAKIILRGELQTASGFVMLFDELELEADFEASIRFSSQRNDYMMAASGEYIGDKVAECSDEGAEIELSIASNPEGPFKTYGSGICRLGGGFPSLDEDDPVNFFGQVRPLELFWVRAKITDPRGNEAEQIQVFQRKPLIVNMGDPKVGSEVGSLEYFKIYGSERYARMVGKIESNGRMIMSFDDLLTGPGGGVELGSIDLRSVRAGDPITLTVEHFVDSDPADVRFGFVAEFVKAAAPADPELRFDFPGEVLNTEGKPTLWGTCTAYQPISIGASIPIKGLQILQGWLVDSKTIQCSGNGRFGFAAELDMTNINSGEEIDINLQLAGLRRARKLRASFCPTNSAIAGEGKSIAVNENYQPTDSGAYCKVRNGFDGNFNVSYFDPILKRQIPAFIADPEIHRIGKTFFLMGTGRSLGQEPNQYDPYHTSNFMILASEDLVNWRYHSMAFEGTYTEVGSPKEPSGMITLHNRKNRQSDDVDLCRLWGASFDVRDGVVYLIFNAIEDRTEGESICRAGPENITRMTVYVASAPLEHFLSGGSFASPAQNRGHEPAWIGYWNGTRWKYDGGAELQKPVPSNGPGEVDNQGFWGNRICHQYWNCNTVIGIDGFVFRDVTGESWMAYGWHVVLPRGHEQFAKFAPLWNGQHIAMARVAGAPFSMEPSAPKDDFRNLAYRVNQNKEISPGVFDGLDRAGDSHYGIAEGPAIHRAPETNKYYLAYSRNAWNLASYTQNYRVANSVRELGSRDWTRNPDGEKLLAEPDDLHAFDEENNIGGANFAGGMLFTGPNNRTYVVLHRKEHFGWRRIPFIKEINFDASGDILSLKQSHADPRRSLGSFLIPRP